MRPVARATTTAVLRARRGAGLTEYGLLAGLVAVTAIGAVSDGGDRITGIFANTATHLADAASARTASPDDGTSAPTTDPASDADVVFDCHDPDNVDAIAPSDAAECANMLIVNDVMLRSAASSDADPTGREASGVGGNESFAIEGPDGQEYSFADSDRNVFTGQVRNMSFLFSNTSFSGDIAYWDVSSVTDMRRMFYHADAFNQDIGGWDTSSVTDVSSMFSDADIFNQDIGDWDMSSLVILAGMFSYTQDFNQDIGDWDVSGVTDMSYTFHMAEAFDHDIGDWDVSSVENMLMTFNRAGAFNRDLSGWNVDAVTECADVATNAPSWTAPKPGFTDC